jgi:DNA-binding XRE family transcriptional regulator
MNVPHTVTKDTVSMKKADFKALLERMEELEDIVAFDKAMESDDEAFPIELAKRIHKGENAIRVFREYRGLTQEALAEHAGVSKGMISKIESGALQGSVDTLKAIALALSVDLDAIV